jgi:non-homologous end joining protein Ku
MAPRPHWKGYLKLSLVSCPIALYPAISTAERVSFRQVNKQTGNRLRRQLVDEVTREPVDSYEKGRGYEVGGGRLVLVGEEDVEAARQAQRPHQLASAPQPNVLPWPTNGTHADPIEPNRRGVSPAADPAPPLPSPFPARPQNTCTIEIANFVPRVQIDPAYYEKPYYIVPTDEVGQDAFAVIREAIRNQDVVGLGYVVLAGGERPIALEASGKGIRGVTLRFNHEVRSAAKYFAEIPEMALPDEMIRVAEHIIETKTTDFDPALFLEDHFQAALVNIIREKGADLPTPEGPARPSPRQVPNLMDVLLRSVKAERSRRPAPRLAENSLKVGPTPAPRPRPRKAEARR